MRSSTSSSVVPVAPARSGSTSSRLRVVISSRVSTSPRRRIRGRARCGRPPGFSSRAYRNNAPAAPSAGRSAASTPRPSRLATPNSRVSSSRASSGSNSHPSRSATVLPSSATGVWPAGTTTSGGSYRASAAGSSARATVSQANSPVVRSSAARPACSSCRETATRKLLRRCATQSSASTVPGVTVSITSRRTGPLASLGSSTCSQIATRCPLAMRRRRYSAPAFTGTPASGTSAAPPLLREVRVSPSSRAASLASSSNIS